MKAEEFAKLKRGNKVSWKAGSVCLRTGWVQNINKNSIRINWMHDKAYTYRFDEPAVHFIEKEKS